MIPLNSNLATLTRSGIRKFTNLAKSVPDCVMLTIGEPDFDTPEQIKAAALTALFQNRTHYAPTMTAEDFSYYQHHLDAMFFFLGLGDVPALHSDNFHFDETILLKGADFFEKLAEKFQ